MTRFAADHVRMTAMRRTVAIVMGWHLAVNAFIPGLGYTKSLVPLAGLSLATMVLGAFLSRPRVQAAGVGGYVCWLSIKAAQYASGLPKAALLYTGFLAFAVVWAAILWSSEGHEQ